MILPNVVGCGAGKSGTTSLYYYLSQHPDIFMAAAKEVHYFSHNYSRGDVWYQRYFENAAKQIIGEFSTSYLINPEVPARMAHLLPQAKLLFIFRNPIERAYSNYWFSISIGTQSPNETFSEAIRTPAGYNKYVATGLYFQHLERFLDYYSPESIYIMITEYLQSNPQDEMKSCYKFLGVSTDFQPDVKQKFNISVGTSNPLMAVTYRNWITIKNRIKPTFTRFPTSLRRSLALLEIQATRRFMSEKRPPISDYDLEFLQNEYKSHNTQLFDFLGNNIPHWEI